jgi:hypothetical protein
MRTRPSCDAGIRENTENAGREVWRRPGLGVTTSGVISS